MTNSTQRTAGRTLDPLIKLAAGVVAMLSITVAAAGGARETTSLRQGSRAQAHASSRAAAVESVGIVVSDADRAARFYSEVLSFTTESDTETAGEQIERLTGIFGARIRTIRMRLGAEHIELRQFLAPEGRPIPPDSRSNDLWFQHIAIVVSDLPEAYAHLRRHNIRHASSGPQVLPEWNKAAAGIGAFYFKDPDGHVLEVINFPKGKGQERWQQSGGNLFLGIDHTAIVVADTDASLGYYRDTLGLAVAGTSENYGTEQEHLNNVFGAHLRITTLRAPAGPGIELLEYLAPTDARPYPPDSRANDLWMWTTTIRFDGESPLAPVPHARAAAHLARDPDGHVQIIQPSVNNATVQLP